MDNLKKTTVVVVGGGQAGIAASEHLSLHSIDHVVIESKSVAEAWKNRRWDSLVANGPAWHDKFPNLSFEGDGSRFVSKDEVANYMEEYARRINMPVYTNTSVTNVTSKRGGFVVETSTGNSVECQFVVAATGAFQIPLVPTLVPGSWPIMQIHSSDYKRPTQLPEGNVLVVGAGSSGAQIAEELAAKTSKSVYLSVGPHDRPPRSYRGRDFCWWLGVLNKWDAECVPNSEHTTIAVSGANGGQTMDFRRLASQGIVLLGRTNGFRNGKLEIGDDLRTNLDNGDANYFSLLDEADEYIAKHGLDLPLEPGAREMLPLPECVNNPISELDLAEHNITSIVWATGFKTDYSWLSSTKAVSGELTVHKRGVSAESGIYFLGLPWQTRRGSSFIWGVWYDAKYIVDHIAKQIMYLNYVPE